MKKLTKTLIMTTILLSCCFTGTGYHLSPAAAAEDEALTGILSPRAIFDVRIGQPLSALTHLKLIHKTYRDLLADKKEPRFIVEFIGPSVKLISTDRKGFAPEDMKPLDEIAATISAMEKDGIKMEICMFAANIFHIDPASVLPEIQKVPNGWTSLIGYQAKGYSLVPAY